MSEAFDNVEARLEAWMLRAMRFISRCDDDPIDYHHRDLHEEAEHLLRVGFDLWGFDPDGPEAALENCEINPCAALASRLSNLIGEGGNG